MIPAGYMLKKVAARPDWLAATDVEDICSVSNCVSEDFDEYIKYWKHNGYWLFNSPADIEALCQSEGIDTSKMTLFYYEVFEKQFDDQSREWSLFAPELSFPTRVERTPKIHLVGFDVTEFTCGTSPECSPLSCNHLAAELKVNIHCLFDTFEDAKCALDDGKFDDAEPGPYRIFAVYRVGPS